MRKGEWGKVCGLFGDDPYAPAEKGFSIVRPKMISHTAFHRTEWAKQVAWLYMTELRAGRADGHAIRNFVSPYPAEPPGRRHRPGGAKFPPRKEKK